MSHPDEIYDELLVLRCQGGDRKAMEILVQRWHPRLLGFATRLLGDPGAAEDAIQSSWVEVVKRIHAINDPRSIRPWLFRIAANKCADCIRRQVHHRKLTPTIGMGEVTDDLAEQHSDIVQQREQGLRLREALKQLGGEGRELVQLFYFDGLTVRQIAQRTAVPEGTVKSRLHHVRGKLKKILKSKETNDE